LGETVAAVGITNQRETTIAWNTQTGKPYYNAIVWDDTRTSTIANQIACGNPNRFREKTGLPLASYICRNWQTIFTIPNREIMALVSIDGKT
jgi:glycerol kinase